MELTEGIKLLNNESLKQQVNAVWADLGCGTGLFTYALANILQPNSIIYAIDKYNTSLSRHPNPNNILIRQKQLDFISDELELPGLDGILMANSLHFAKKKIPLIQKLSRSLKENCGFLIVEYDTDSPNPWVPFPVSFLSLKKLFKEAGFDQVQKIHERPSAFRTSSMCAAIIGR